MIELISLYYPPWVGASHQEQQIQPVCGDANVGDEDEEDDAGDEYPIFDLILGSVTAKYRGERRERRVMYCHPQTGLAVAGELLGVDLAGGQHHRPRLAATSGAWPGGELVRSQSQSEFYHS